MTSLKKLNFDILEGRNVEIFAFRSNMFCSSTEIYWRVDGECYTVILKKSLIIMISLICFHPNRWKNAECNSSSEDYQRY
jgi:hypothetical protein